VLPGHAHFLFVNTAAAGYSLTVPGNVSYTTGISDNAGAAIALPDGVTIVDQVGVATTLAGYREGNALTTQLTTNTNRSYERKPGGLATTLQDNGDNLTDFQPADRSRSQPAESAGPVVNSVPLSIDFGGVLTPGSRTLTASIRTC